MLAAEYDNALDIMQKIGLQANRQKSNGNGSAGQDDYDSRESGAGGIDKPARMNEENDGHELELDAPLAPLASARLQATHGDVMHQPPSPVDNEVITHSQDRPGKAKGRQPNRAVGRIAAPQQVRTEEIYSAAAESTAIGSYSMNLKSKKSSVRSIEHEKVKPRIAPIVRERPKKVMEHGEEIEIDEPDEQESELTLEQHLIKCPACGAEVSARSVVCVSCGEFIKN